MNGAKLKELLEARGINQSKLARSVGVTEAYISYLVHGFKQPTAPVLKRIADVLGCTMDELME